MRQRIKALSKVLALAATAAAVACWPIRETAAARYWERGAAGGKEALRQAAPAPLRRTMIVTAYCPCRLCCGAKARGVTASGKPAVGHLVAADRNIPFGTMLRVPGYAGEKAVPVLDRGGAIRGNRLDVLFSTHPAARQWGVRTLRV